MATNTSPPSILNVGTELRLRPEMLLHSKRPRLQDFSYRGEYTYHVILATKDRIPAFTATESVGPYAQILGGVASTLSFSLLAYGFVPDHLHILTQGLAGSADLVRFMQRFKQRTGFAFKQQTGRQLWQESFFDRILRKDEDARKVADYIFANPVAAGLCDHVDSYPFSGGSFYDATRAEGGAEASSLHASGLKPVNLEAAP